MSKMEGGERKDNRNMSKWFAGDLWNYKLFLDDNRDVHWIYPEGHELNSGKWRVARNYNEFVKIILFHGLPKFVSFDHDLSECAVKECLRAIDKNDEYNYNRVFEKTGLDCAKYLIEYCQKNSLTLPEYKVHSANPLGTENIKAILKRFEMIQRAI